MQRSITHTPDFRLSGSEGHRESHRISYECSSSIARLPDSPKRFGREDRRGNRLTAMMPNSESTTVRNQLLTHDSSSIAKTTGYDYVLITPARNEAQFIESTIRSVVAQTIHPRCWVIVSDGSTDRTNEIVQAYAARQGWIELIVTP